ncbi:MAG: NTP transferase domain-containing protein [SAR324 cluster bacterium]|nr:NTP transferase domain-containing protein [SAR324 cluster bacterium]
MRAMILGAGRGERLRPLTDSLPKILVPVLGVPMLDRLVAFLGRAGITELALNTFHLGDLVTRHVRALAATTPAAPPITLFPEKTLLGTGGGLRNAASFWGEEPLLVWNGDILAELDPAALLKAHQGSGAVATLVMQARATDSRLLVDSDGSVIGLDSERRGERRLLREPAGVPQGMAFHGISLLAPGLRKWMGREGPFDLIDVLLEAAAAGPGVQTLDAGQSFWGTTGSPEQLAALEQGLAARPDLLARWTPEG